MKNLKKINENFENDMDDFEGMDNNVQPEDELDEWSDSKNYNQELFENIPLYDDSKMRQEAQLLAKKYNWEPDEMIAIAYNMFVEVNEHQLAKEFIKCAFRINRGEK